MTDIQHVSLLDLLPPNLQEDKSCRAAALALDTELQAISAAAKRLPLLNNLESLLETWIDELLWQYHVEGVDLAANTAEKRALIRNSIEVHRKKGTKAALERILELLGMRGIISEWFEYGGQPGTFRIQILEVTKPITADMLTKLDTLINQYKNVRSWVEGLNIFLTSRGSVYSAWGVQSGEIITVYPKEA